MINVRKISLTLAQILVGCFCGILVGGLLLSLINLAWGGLQRVDLGGLPTALLLLISFLIVYAAAVAATAEAVRQMGRFIPRQTSRRRIYEGSFLGTCVAVVVMTATRSDWINTLEEWHGRIGALLRFLVTLFYFVIVAPVKLATFWLPAIALLIIAAPIGAAIGYNLPPPEEGGLETEDSEGQPARKGGKKKT
jgi:hypothetical protein